MIIEKLNEIRNNFRNKTPGEQLQIVGLILLRILAMIIALFLSWTCNANYGLAIRVLLAILSAVFAEIYILYYTVYHIVMGVKCGIPSSPDMNATETLSASLIKADKKIELKSSSPSPSSTFPFKQKSKFSDYVKSIKNVL